MKAARKGASESVVCVIVVRDASLVVGLSAGKVFTCCGSDEVRAEWFEEVSWCLVYVNGRMPSGVDMVSSGERGAGSV